MIRFGWILLAGLALSMPLAAGENGAGDPGILSVQGEGEVVASPDMAVVRLGAEAEAKDAAAAQREVSAIMTRALDAIEKVGIPERHITTTGLSLNPVYSQKPPVRGQNTQPEAPTIVGYRARNSVRVRIEDLAKVAMVIDAGIEAGANRLEDLSFDLKNDKEYRREALRRAVGDAKGKAQVMADALGVTLAGVDQVSEGGISFIRPPMERGTRMMAMSVADAGTPVASGELRIEARVSLSYRLGETALAAR